MTRARCGAILEKTGGCGAGALLETREGAVRKTYQVLAYAIAALVVVQAGAIAWASSG